jgi:hypothetical protein
MKFGLPPRVRHQRQLMGDGEKLREARIKQQPTPRPTSRVLKQVFWHRLVRHGIDW